MSKMRRLFSGLLLVLKTKRMQVNLHIWASYSGDNSFGKYSRVFRSCKLHDVSLGRHSYVNSHSWLSGSNIGNFTSIGRHVKIGGLGNHKRTLSTHPSFYDAHPPGYSFCIDNSFHAYAPVNIGNDVWIGDGAVVMDGVTVGDGAIISAGALVHKNVPPYAIVGGNPMQIIKYRFLDAEISKLLAVKWWDKPDEEIELIKEKIVSMNFIDL